MKLAMEKLKAKPVNCGEFEENELRLLSNDFGVL